MWQTGTYELQAGNYERYTPYDDLNTNEFDSLRPINEL